mgnify:CR=1 FL=1
MKEEKELRATLLTERQYAKYLALDEGLRDRYLKKLLDEQPVDVRRTDDDNEDEEEDEYIEVDGERRTRTVTDESTGLDTYDIVNKEGKNNKDASVHALVIDNYYLNLGISFKYPPKDPKNPTKEEITTAVLGDEEGRMLYIEDPKRGVYTVVFQDDRYNTLATGQLNEKAGKGLVVVGDAKIAYDFNASKRELRKFAEEMISKESKEQEEKKEEERIHPAERLASENFEKLGNSSQLDGQHHSMKMGL